MLAFESRNPAVRAWRDWAAEPPSTRTTMHGDLTEWVETEGPDDDGVVDLICRTVFEQTGETVVDRQRLAFRDRARLEVDLAAAGFEVEAVSGHWDGRPFAAGDRLLTVRTRRASHDRE